MSKMAYLYPITHCDVDDRSRKRSQFTEIFGMRAWSELAANPTPRSRARYMTSHGTPPCSSHSMKPADLKKTGKSTGRCGT